MVKKLYSLETIMPAHYILQLLAILGQYRQPKVNPEHIVSRMRPCRRTLKLVAAQLKL